MKSFITYLTESAEKTYEFKIKLANLEMTSELQDRLEHALKAYDLQSISKPKQLPYSQVVVDFPNFSNVEVYLINVVLKYPCTDEQLRQTINNQARIPEACIKVVAKGHPGDEYQEQINQAAEDLESGKEKKALLDTPDLGGESAQDSVGQKRIDSLLKDLETRKYDIAKEEK